MILRKFYINLVIRIIVILINMTVLAMIARGLFEKQLMFTFIIAAMVLIFQVILLFNYINKTNKLFTKFILAISNMDFASKFGEDFSQTPYKGLNKALNKILLQYHEVSIEKEKQQFLTQHIIESIPAGILVIDNSEKVTFKNSLVESLIRKKEINSLKQLRDFFPQIVEKLEATERSGSFMLNSFQGTESIKLSVKLKTINLFNQEQKLITIQDVSKELDAGEIDAIQRLMRILTHEIMNSLTPINSLAETVSMLMSDSEGQEKPLEEFSEKNYNDVRESVLAIQERGTSLDYFVNNFRTLTKLPEKLEKGNVEVKNIFSSVCRIMAAETSSFNIESKIETDGMTINIDSALIEQVIINLLTNSLTAVSEKEKPEISLRAYESNDQVIIQVYDNGVGIPADKINDVFIPFYTTKEKGSGIGLSLARQIMNLHNGSIHIQSKPGKETIVSLRF